jgi:SAM-dependent methyltransferase
MNDVACIFCGKHSDNIAITENGYNGLKCCDCNLIYISPRPTDSEISEIYTDDHALMYADAQFQFDTYSRMVASRTLRKIGGYRKSGSVLELGPGGGTFLSEARKRGYEPFGIELNPIERRWITGKLGIPCEGVALNEDSFQGRQFDIIYCKDVLSHLPDPISVFRNANRALKNGGLLVFETGNIADVRKEFYKYFAQFSYPDHLFYFGEKSLKHLLELTGFACRDIFRENIMLQLLLQKVLWKMKDPLKDKSMEFRSEADTGSKRASSSVSLKRRIRLLYRYACDYLIRMGVVLPKEGWPLKLIVVAEKAN